MSGVDRVVLTVWCRPCDCASDRPKRHILNVVSQALSCLCDLFQYVSGYKTQRLIRTQRVDVFITIVKGRSGFLRSFIVHGCSFQFFRHRYCNQSPLRLVVCILSRVSRSSCHPCHIHPQCRDTAVSCSLGFEIRCNPI